MKMYKHTGNPQFSLFQRDNSPIHTTKIITAFLDKYGFGVTDHPYSSDLDPID